MAWIRQMKTSLFTDSAEQLRCPRLPLTSPHCTRFWCKRLTGILAPQTHFSQIFHPEYYVLPGDEKQDGCLRNWGSWRKAPILDIPRTLASGSLIRNNRYLRGSATGISCLCTNKKSPPTPAAVYPKESTWRGM